MAFGLSTENGLNWEELKKNSKLAADLLTLACLVVFAVLTGCDLKRAFIKRATWLPGKSFALSGVTVQIIAWWTSLSTIYNDYSGKFDTLVWENYMVVSGRVAVCVFVGYLLPEMAAESVMAFWALAITISAQIVSELHVLSNGSTDYEEERERGDLSEYLDGILLVCIIVLGVILCCTVLASKTIRGLMRERILAIAKESKFELRSLYSITGQEKFQSSDENMETTCDDFKDEVLRSWFVARASQIDYVISRSVLSSVVWIILTICSIVTICSIALPELEIELYGAISPLLSFIAIGYLVIWWRWLVAQLYFGPHGQNWRERLCVEGFWTSYIVELIDMYEERRLQRSNSKISWLNNSESLSTKIITIVRLHNLLYLVLMFQVCVVFFINVCGLLSEVTVGRFLYWCRERMSKEDLVTSHENYERILKSLSMPGEDPSALWEANKIALNKAKKLMDKGCVEGSSSCKEIHSFLDSYSVQWAKDGTQLLKLLRGKALPSVLSKFPSVEEQCLKMTIVSLLTIFLRLHNVGGI